MPVIYEKHDHIGMVTLSRPEARNAWGEDFTEGMTRTFAAMEDEMISAVRCCRATNVARHEKRTPKLHGR